MNHDTGKSLKLNADDMSRMQDMLAESLDMERGTAKAETGREHLERNDFIIAKQKEEAEQARKKAEEEQRKSELLKCENERKEKAVADLDKEIAEKAEKANRENGNRILQGGAAIANAIANKAGMGKYAAIEKENAELKASVPMKLKALQLSYEEAVTKEAERQTAQLRQENGLLKAQCSSITANYNRLSSSYKDIAFEKKRAESALIEYKRGEQTRMDTFTARSKWKDDVLATVALLLARTDQLLCQAINAIIRFAKSKCSSFFFDEEASVIKLTMDNYASTPAEHQSIGKWLLLAAQKETHLTEREVTRAGKEVDSVAQGRYNRRLGMGGGMKL